ncbi:hypothetical protein J8273_2287 [Carpediemonas membranifera]|uniref:Uncharacterized protein n=1 Tax=Carpediemonas membranifera TaxID=201153 RepID=A0A8J6AWI5_9EUKA|nr:hypothetical protein J8273_2287 [Carpediemonas membranifera]|eukprot:KAG9395938.1 hypothetical protein J8273_2287 [Carpediemonas membranifera]
MVRYFCLDVESAATGRGHNDRAPCSASLVDFDGKTLFNTAIAIEGPVHSAMTPITGMTMEDIKQGMPFAAAKEKLSVMNDIEAMKLTKGVDYHSIDIAEEFKLRNPKYNNFDFFSLAKEVYAAYGVIMHAEGQKHDPDEDAKYSMRLYRDYIHNKSTSPKIIGFKSQMQRRNWKHSWPSAVTRPMRTIDGVCSLGQVQPR